MSLTSFLKDKDVKGKFKKEFRKPRMSTKNDPIAPPLTRHYSLVGTAFDYLMRFYLEYLNENAVPNRKWVAEAALEKVDKHLQDKSLYKQVGEIISEAKTARSKFIKTGKPTYDLLKSVFSLAQIDLIYRAGIVDENLGIVDDKDIEDLKNLFSLIDTETFKAKKTCLLNPTFGFASLLVGGADADIVIDDTLIDIKTTKRLEFTLESFHQLIGYYTLYRIGGFDVKPSYHDLEKLGIYFSRYGYLHVINIEDVIDEEKFTEFQYWFEKKAMEVFGPLEI